MFIPLQTKSDYSLGYGTASPEELAERAALLGYRAIALADVETLAGQVRFHSRCRSLGLRPITGVELHEPSELNPNRDASDTRLLLLAGDTDGYRNLCRIVSRRSGGVPCEACEDGGDLVRLVSRYAEGLFALSDDPLMIQALLDGGGFEKDRLGLLIIRPGPGGTAGEGEQTIIHASRRLGVLLIASLDAVFPAESDYPLHLLQGGVRFSRNKSRSGSRGAHRRETPICCRNRWLRPPGQAGELFSDLPQAVAGAESLADSCLFDLTLQSAPAPPVDLLTGKPAEKRLAELCGRAIKERLREGTWSPRHVQRVEQEITVVSSLGLPSYFLVVGAVIGHCREEGIPVSIRGSAVSSLLLHLLGASSVDPVEEGLFFERFLHDGKPTWPDIDLDLPSHRRDEVIEWVYDRFGRDRVAMVAAHHRFQGRSALREGLKAMGVKEIYIRRLLDALPPPDLEPDRLEIDDPQEIDLGATDDLPRGEIHFGAFDFSRVDLPSNVRANVREALPLIQRLVGRPRHLALHPGGILIGQEPLDGVLPLARAIKGAVIAEYDAADIAALGLFKIDLLGNRCLSEIEETLRLAGDPRPGRIEGISAGDASTLSLINGAQTIGCFQLESPAMRSLLARLSIRKQSDLVAALALIRPGPAAGRAKEKYLRGEAQDLLLFEEDIMALLSRVGGVSLAQSDQFRAGIVASGGDQSLLQDLKREFLEKAGLNRDGTVGRERLESAWKAAAQFAAYSFNKAHAASYGRLAYLSAHMKAHYPVEFTCALLNYHQGLYPLRTVAAEMGRRGVKIALPHVNHSENAPQPEASENGGGRRVRVGFDQVKILSRRTADRLLNERTLRGPFTDFADLVGRVSIRGRELAALVLSGACDGLAPLTENNYPFMHEALLEKIGEGLPSGDFNALRIERPGTQSNPGRLPLYQGLVRAMNELRYLEMHITSHPMSLLRPEADRYGCIPIGAVVFEKKGARLKLAAMVAAMRRVPTRWGIIQFITFEDETGLLEAVVLPSVYHSMGERVTTPGPFLAQGRLIHDLGASNLEITRLIPFLGRPHPFGTLRSPSP